MSELALAAEGCSKVHSEVDLLSVARESEQIKSLGATLIASGLLPDSIKKPEAAMAIMLKGRELGVGPMYSLTHIAVVNGRPTLSAELMVALVQRAGHKLRVIQTDAQECVVEGVRRDDPDFPQRSSFTMDDASRAGLVGKGPWKQYPAAMLRARAISALCRFMFADVLQGVSYVPEEMGATVDAEGEVIQESTDDIAPDEKKANQLTADSIELYYALPLELRPDYEQVLEWSSKNPQRTFERMLARCEQNDCLPPKYFRGHIDGDPGKEWDSNVIDRSSSSDWGETE